MTIEWQPIETAPKDGSEIIYMNGNEVSTCRWSSAETDALWEEDWDPEWWNDYTDQGAHPKYWMPLPPVGTEVGAGKTENANQ